MKYLIGIGIIFLLFFAWSFDDRQQEASSEAPSYTSEENNYSSDYEKEGYTDEETTTYEDDLYFNGYECTEDCSGHEAGYDWAEENGIESEDDCGGNSDSFIEGCYSYVEENYDEY